MKRDSAYFERQAQTSERILDYWRSIVVEYERRTTNERAYVQSYATSNAGKIASDTIRAIDGLTNDIAHGLADYETYNAGAFVATQDMAMLYAAFNTVNAALHAYNYRTIDESTAIALFEHAYDALSVWIYGPDVVTT